MVNPSHDYSDIPLRDRPHVSAWKDAEVSPETAKRFRSDELEAKAREPFVGITTDGHPIQGLFPLQATGIATEPITAAAVAFLDSLSPAQRETVGFSLDSVQWRRWINVHGNLFRHGLFLHDLDGAQRRAALRMIGSTLSLRGFANVRGVMRLNEYVADLTGQRDQFGEWLYFVSMFGDPTSGGPWGWQIDGHHLNVHCLVLGDQVALTPFFMGSEPMTAADGRFAGTTVLEAEDMAGLMLAQSLTPDQAAIAVIDPAASNNADSFAAKRSPNLMLAEAFRDNMHIAYDGILAPDLSAEQQHMLRTLTNVFIGWTAEDIARVRMDEIERHWDDTHFVWMGDRTGGPFYFRVQSPVVMIEYNHQTGLVFDVDAPTKLHTHAIVRTPNGNDYGKDLLRQHFAQYGHNADGSHEPRHDDGDTAAHAHGGHTHSHGPHGTHTHSHGPHTHSH